MKNNDFSRAPLLGHNPAYPLGYAPRYPLGYAPRYPPGYTPPAPPGYTPPDPPGQSSVQAASYCLYNVHARSPPGRDAGAEQVEHEAEQQGPSEGGGV